MKKIKELFKNPYFYFFILLTIVITSFASISIVTKKSVSTGVATNKNINISNNKSENSKSIAKCYVDLKTYEFPKGRKYADSVAVKVYNLIDEPISAKLEFIVLDKDNRVISGDPSYKYFDYIPPKSFVEKEEYLETSNHWYIEGEDLKKVKIQILKFTAQKLEQKRR